MEWTKLFRGFFNSEKIGGLLLLFCTIVSLVIANSNWGDGYILFWHQHIDLSIGNIHLNYTIEQWINDGLMTLFFLLVGLEIERELYCGELSVFTNALLPIGAAIGGMIVPALLHYSVNAGTPTQAGFGIPMATDIAFTLGILALAGKRVPYSLKIFITALAIIDDLGAVLVIAIFYSHGLQWIYIGASAGILGLLYLFSRLKINALYFYLIPGIVLWYCMMQSGLHPTIAGVLLAFVIPFSGENEATPSYKLQNALHIPVGWIIVPLFALANTGIILHKEWATEMVNDNSIGIIAGLVIGKPLGILAGCWLLTRFSKIKLPHLAGWRKLLGVALLGGIGFTMSIFISNLAFTDDATISYAKIAVLIASFIAGSLGLVVLLFTKKVEE